MVDEGFKTNKKNLILCLDTEFESLECNYSGAYTLVKETIAIVGARADEAAQQADESNKQVTFKKYALFTNFTSQINLTTVENEEYVDIVMLIYNLVEYVKCYAKTSHSLW